MSDSSIETRVLAIHAHPDDVELTCAGTLALLKERGCEITIATMTAGDCGSAALPPREVARVRRAEAAQAAELLGAEYVCLEFKDLAICFDNDSRRRVVEAIRKARPDIVLTAPPVDYMSDHEVTSRLVRDAAFSASCPNYLTQQWDPAEALPRVPALFYVDPIAGVDWYGTPFRPEFVIDISSTFELKLEMLACHDSQRAWLRRQHGMGEYLDSCRSWSQARGRTIGAAFGEGFTQHKGHPYPRDNVLHALIVGSGQ